MNFFEKVGATCKRLGKKGKMLLCTAVISCTGLMMSMAVSATGTPPATPTVNLGDIGDKFLSSFTGIINSLLDLAVGMVPIGLTFIGAVLLIKKGKSLLTKTV